VAELVDALASGASGFTAVKVRVLSWAPLALFAVVRHPSKMAENTEDQDAFLSATIHSAPGLSELGRLLRESVDPIGFDRLIVKCRPR
jgi:hypothetical protein